MESSDDDLLIHNDEGKDPITVKFREDATHLANLRETTVIEVAGIKAWLNSMTFGCVIGVSPTDKVLHDSKPIEITQLIINILRKTRARDVSGALVPLAPLRVALTGEYSPTNHRWHYHGLINVTTIETLMKIKRLLTAKIGRTVTGALSNQPLYIDYMFKQYTNENYTTFYPWNKDKCFTALIRNVVL